MPVVARDRGALRTVVSVSARPSSHTSSPVVASNDQPSRLASITSQSSSVSVRTITGSRGQCSGTRSSTLGWRKC